MALGCSHVPSPYLLQLDESRAVVADLRIEFNKASDASDRAVMADTDEASIAFAHEAEQALIVVDGDARALSPLLRAGGRHAEIQSFEEFRNDFADYRKVDQRILALAVENTNLKAQRLSFGPVRAAADSFHDSLMTVPPAVAPKDRCRAEELVASATLAVREIQVLHAPHIAEAEDLAMTRLEKEMGDLYTQAQDSMKALTALAPSGTSGLGAAGAALTRFKELSDELIVLSRRNSNVVSLNLSLRAKPPLVTACDESLRALQDALAAAGSKATR